MNENHNSRFFDGFLLGLIIGGVAVFLLGTKSGKRILKKLSEDGLDGFSDIIENYKNAEEESSLDENEVAEPEGEAKHVVEVEKVVVTPKKRFFKRFKRVD